MDLNKELDALDAMLKGLDTTRNATVASAHPPDVLGHCAGCKKIVLRSSSASFQGRVYHSRCLTCATCGKESKFELEGKLYCEEHYKAAQLPTCSVCAKLIEEEMVSLGADMAVKLHVSCFTCKACGAGLADKPFVLHESLPYCSNCYYKNFGTLCNRCSQPILPNDEGVAPIVRVAGLVLHKHCYTCYECNKELGIESYPVDGKLFCYDHALQATIAKQKKVEEAQHAARDDSTETIESSPLPPPPSASS